MRFQATASPVPLTGDDPAASAVRHAAKALADGQTVVVHDDEVCVLAVAAAAVDAGTIAHFARSARGLVCVAMSPDRVQGLGLRMHPRGVDVRAPAFTLSVDSRVGTTTGISAADRAATIHELRATEPNLALVVPGHILPIRTAEGGVRSQPAYPEACVDLARVAGIEPVVAVCSMLDDEGHLLSASALAASPEFHHLPAVSARQLATYLAERAASDVQHFRDAMSALVSGVAAVTTRDAAGRPRGLLATSLASYTDDPPSLLLSVAHTSRTHDTLVAAPRFGVHLLASDQGDVGRVLSSRADDKFAAFDWTWEGDVPRIAGTLAYLRCTHGTAFSHHDHSIVVGDVEHVEVSGATPLVYFQRHMKWSMGPVP
jgi:flavin reductase ActVB